MSWEREGHWNGHCYSRVYTPWASYVNTFQEKGLLSKYARPEGTGFVLSTKTTPENTEEKAQENKAIK